MSVAACGSDSPVETGDPGDGELPADNGRILTTVQGVGLFILGDTGGVLQDLTSGTGLDPAIAFWSGTGDHIGMRTRDAESGARRVYVMDADGSDVQAVSQSSFSPSGFFSVSPAGSVAYRDESWSIFRVDRDGTGHLELTPAGYTGTDPSFGPSGEWILYAGADAGGTDGVFRVRPDGTDHELIAAVGSVASGHSMPAFSPDGGHILFADGDQLIVMDVNARDVTTVSTAVLSRDGFPRWAPDGSRIAFRSGLVGGGVAIRVVAWPSGDPVAAFELEDIDLGYPSWAPDSQRLAMFAQGQVVVGDVREPAELDFIGEGVWPGWKPGT